MIKAIRAALVLGFAILAAAPATAQERTDFGPFYVLASEPDRIYLDGPLDRASSQTFWTVTSQYPDASTLVINNTEAVRLEALVIAEFVWYGRMNTIVPAGSACANACLDIFLAGMSRTAEGDIAIGRSNETLSEQYIAMDELDGIEVEALSRYGAGQPLIDALGAMDVGEQRTLTPDEIASFGLNRSADEGVAQANAQPDRAPLPDVDVNATITDLGRTSGALVLFDALGNIADRQEALVAWSREDGDGISAVRVEVVTIDTSLVIDFWPISLPGVETFSQHLTVGLDRLDPGLRFARLEGLGTAQAGDAYRLLDGFVTARTTFDEAPFYSLFHVLLPRLLSADTVERLINSDQFVLYFTLEDGTLGAFVFGNMDEARAAFEAILGPHL